MEYGWTDTYTGEVPQGVVVQQPRRVVVCWLDAKSFANEWLTLEEIQFFRPETCETRGFLCQETDEAVFIAQTRGEEYGYHNVFSIPRGCILSIEDD